MAEGYDSCMGNGYSPCSCSFLVPPMDRQGPHQRPRMDFPPAIAAARKSKEMSLRRAVILMTIVDAVISTGRCYLNTRALAGDGVGSMASRIHIARKRIKHLAAHGWLRIIPAAADGSTPRELVPNLKRIAEVPQ